MEIRISVFFLGVFTFFNLKIMISTHTLDFCAKDGPVPPDLGGKTLNKLPDFYNRSQLVAKT
jgi:hypothetical protein